MLNINSMHTYYISTRVCIPHVLMASVIDI